MGEAFARRRDHRDPMGGQLPAQRVERALDPADPRREVVREDEGPGDLHQVDILPEGFKGQWVCGRGYRHGFSGSGGSGERTRVLGARGLELTDEDIAELASEGFPSYRARSFARRARARAGRVKARLRR